MPCDLHKLVLKAAEILYKLNHGLEAVQIRFAAGTGPPLRIYLPPISGKV